MSKIILWLGIGASIFAFYQCSESRKTEEKQKLEMRLQAEGEFRKRYGIHTLDFLKGSDVAKIYLHDMDSFSSGTAEVSIEVQDRWPLGEKSLIASSIFRGSIDVARASNNEFRYELSGLVTNEFVTAVCEQNLWPDWKRLREESFGEIAPRLFFYGFVTSHGKLRRLGGEFDARVYPIDFECEAIFISDPASVDKYLSSIPGLEVLAETED